AILFKQVNFEIIFVTAYNQYALKAFEVSAIDYLLKPIDGDLLQKAVEKARKRSGSTQMQERLEHLKHNTATENFKRIALPVAEGLLFVEVEDIVYLEAEGAYTHFYLKDGEHIFLSKRLKYFEDLLDNWKGFYRSHRSYLIHVNYVKKFNRNENLLLLDNGVNIPIARERKAEFEKLLQEFSMYKR
ncbi:MAG: LytTR family DNA-binding domain-containing protein, partial [Bacteroidota bacterium]